MRIGRWILSAIVALGLVGWGVYTVRLQQANHKLALALEAERQMTVNDVAYHTNQAQTYLGKALASGSIAQTVRYLSNVQQHAVDAGNAFKQLPIESNVGAEGSKFIQQIGDLSSSLANRQAAGQEMTEQDRTQLTQIKARADQLSANLSVALADFTGTNQRMIQPVAFTPNLLLKGYKMQAVTKPASGEQSPISYTQGGFTTVTDTNKEMPTLIYDGPFSEHVSKEPPKMKGPAITQQQAEAKLAQYVTNFAQYRVTSRTEVNGKIPTFAFLLERSGETGQFSVNIAKEGGYLVQTNHSRPYNESTLNLKDAKAKGSTYLNALGFTGMVPTYGVAEGGAATIVYAWSDGEVLHYRDQIKLKIALDTGEIVGFDGRQYITSHHTREKMKPTVTANAAQAKVNPKLAVQRVQLTAIPNNAGTGDILCWEFTGLLGKQRYLVYINATSGNEQQILQLIESDRGTFTI
ncbi:MAG TPA: germination protein YpeB [Symbiobacteriaceae bacterium]|nr:germination protein YpeB [Symbiobacteriaceae bacterium]